jgi:hypothetical protein
MMRMASKRAIAVTGNLDRERKTIPYVAIGKKDEILSRFAAVRAGF